VLACLPKNTISFVSTGFQNKTGKSGKMASERLALSLGTMTFGWSHSSNFLDLAKSTELALEFLDAGHVEIDTALLYSEGESEKFIGAMAKARPDKFARAQIATKINPLATNSLSSLYSGAPRTGGYTEEKVKLQMDMCLGSLGMEKVPILYLHMPDHGIPIEATLKALTALHKQGRFEELGLSNYAAWEVAHIVHLCRQNGWIQPTVYQGVYNAVSRNIEAELIPVCRKFQIRLRIYNPLAGGMLTGKHNGLMGQKAEEGRFKENVMYQTRYWKPSFFKAMDIVKAACDEAQLPMTEASFRWLMHHSQLSAKHNDGIILGVSSLTHLTANMKACAANDKLPETVLKALNEAWEISKADAPPYFRGWSNMDNES
jgi:aflatoxin B1 aldehyde reductase